MPQGHIVFLWSVDSHVCDVRPGDRAYVVRLTRCDGLAAVEQRCGSAAGALRVGRAWCDHLVRGDWVLDPRAA